MVKRVPVSSDRKAELREDFAKNVPQHMRRALSAYVQWLHEHERPAERLCPSGVPTWQPMQWDGCVEPSCFATVCFTSVIASAGVPLA